MVEIWMAIVLTWNNPNPTRTIDKEFASVNECWNHYEEGVGESMFGRQNVDHQGNPPKIDFHFARDGVAIRTYKGKDTNRPVWLSCERK